MSLLTSVIPLPYRVAAIAVLILALTGGSYFAGYEHEARVLAAEKAVVAQAAADQLTHTKSVDAVNLAAKDKAYEQLQAQLAGYQSANADLSKRLSDSSTRSISVVSSTVAAACKLTDSGTTGAAEGAPSAAAGPVAVIDEGVLTDDLKLSIANIDSLIAVEDEAAKVQQ